MMNTLCEVITAYVLNKCWKYCLVICMETRSCILYIVHRNCKFCAGFFIGCTLWRYAGTRDRSDQFDQIGPMFEELGLCLGPVFVNALKWKFDCFWFHERLLAASKCTKCILVTVTYRNCRPSRWVVPSCPFTFPHYRVCRMPIWAEHCLEWVVEVCCIHCSRSWTSRYSHWRQNWHSAGAASLRSLVNVIRLMLLSLLSASKLQNWKNWSIGRHVSWTAWLLKYRLAVGASDNCCYLCRFWQGTISTRVCLLVSTITQAPKGGFLWSLGNR